MPTTFYHISRLDLGVSPTLTAKVPETCCPVKEGTTPRVCFSPSLRQCLHALSGVAKATLADAISELMTASWDDYLEMKRGPVTLDNPTIYTTRKKLVLPPDVSDFRLTGEQWSIKDIKVNRLGYIDLLELMTNRSSVLKIPVTNNPTSRLSSQSLDVWFTALCLKSRLCLETSKNKAKTCKTGKNS